MEGRGGMWCLCYLNSKHPPLKQKPVILYLMTCVKLFGDAKECLREDRVLTKAKDVNANGRKR